MKPVNHAFKQNHLRILVHHGIYGDDVTERVGLPILHVFWNTRDMVESALAELRSLPACHYLKPQGIAVVKGSSWVLDAVGPAEPLADHVSTHLESA